MNKKQAPPDKQGTQNCFWGDVGLGPADPTSQSYQHPPKTVEEYEKEIDRLCEICKEQAKEEAKLEEEAWKEWKEFIDSFMLKHNVSKSDAIKHDMKVHDAGDEVEYYCWLKHLSFDREADIKALI